ncbi:hypothetical protein [Pedobacter sp. Leaf194]|uniref:hypothetical protein n=1 Tax=Pedobacter sp. Leaf194 TaxID=1736297 RepID=UPI0007024187|nr:hypothetical protein [Pedobacter sp. Leaf194]KQS36012.1 hypothetical protein ASG14_11255 [Pedobacter sp. Leaf194]
MEEDNQSGHVPAQVTGSKMDAVDERTATTEEEAELLFNRAAIRLRNVNEWEAYAGISGFKLTDANGAILDRQAEIGDFIRIDIPGPGTKAGEGYDWVKITSIKSSGENGEQILSMTVHPTQNPLTEEEDTAHFLKDGASSTFIVRKKGLVVYAEEHGRNEEPNTDEGNVYDKARNFVVGMAAKAGFSYPQWKSLVKGLLAD